MSGMSNAPGIVKKDIPEVFRQPLSVFDASAVPQLIEEHEWISRCPAPQYRSCTKAQGERLILVDCPVVQQLM